MNDFFKRFVSAVSDFGEIKEAHLYHYDYISATVRGNDGKIYDFTVSIREDEKDDAV